MLREVSCLKSEVSGTLGRRKAALVRPQNGAAAQMQHAFLAFPAAIPPGRPLRQERRDPLENGFRERTRGVSDPQALAFNADRVQPQKISCGNN